MTPAPREKEVQRSVLAYLRAHGFAAVRVNSGAVTAYDRNGKRRFFRMNSEPGCADILACVRGRFVSIECKAENARTDPERLAKQHAFAVMIEKAGGVALTVCNLNELVADLKEAGLV